MEILKNIQVKKIAIGIAVVLGLKYLLPFVLPFLIAMVINGLFYPFFKKVQKKIGMSPAWTMLLLLFLFSVFAGVIFYTGGQYLFELCCELGEDKECQKIVRLLSLNEKIVPWATENGVGVLTKFGNVFTTFFVTILSTIFITKDYDKIQHKLQTYAWYKRILEIAIGVKKSSLAYLKAQGLIMLIVIVICTIGIFVAGYKGAILRGILTGLLDAFPVFGTGTVFWPWSLLLVLKGNYTEAVILMGTYFVSTCTREYLEPRLVGNNVDILPIFVLAGVYVGVQVYGMSGIILGPLTLLVLQEIYKR